MPDNKKNLDEISKIINKTLGNKDPRSLLERREAAYKEQYGDEKPSINPSTAKVNIPANNEDKKDKELKNNIKIVKTNQLNKENGFNNVFDSTSINWTIIFPIIATILGFGLAKIFDWNSNKKEGKKTLISRINTDKSRYLTLVKNLKDSFCKNHFSDNTASYSIWIANKMVGVNPFEDLNANAIRLFGEHSNIYKLIKKLYHNAELINKKYDWEHKKHLDFSLDLANNIADDVSLLIDMITLDIKK